MSLIACMGCHAWMEPLQHAVLEPLGYLLCDNCAVRLRGNGMDLGHRIPGRMVTLASLADSPTTPTVHCPCGKAVESTSTRQHSGEQQLCAACANVASEAVRECGLTDHQAERLARNLLGKPQPCDLLDRLDAIAADLAEALLDAIDASADKPTLKCLVASLSECQHAGHTLIRNRSIAA